MYLSICIPWTCFRWNVFFAFEINDFLFFHLSQYFFDFLCVSFISFLAPRTLLFYGRNHCNRVSHKTHMCMHDSHSQCIPRYRLYLSRFTSPEKKRERSKVELCGFRGNFFERPQRLHFVHDPSEWKKRENINTSKTFRRRLQRIRVRQEEEEEYQQLDPDLQPQNMTDKNTSVCPSLFSYFQSSWCTWKTHFTSFSSRVIYLEHYLWLWSMSFLSIEWRRWKEDKERCRLQRILSWLTSLWRNSPVIIMTWIQKHSKEKRGKRKERGKERKGERKRDEREERRGKERKRENRRRNS